MVSVPVKFLCRASGRVMKNPVLALYDTDEYVLDRLVFERAKVGGETVLIDGKDVNLSAFYSMSHGNLSAEIKEWLHVNQFSVNLVDMQCNPVLRMRLYGEFQKIQFPLINFNDLSYADNLTKRLASDSIITVLEQTEFRFSERIDQIESALKIGFGLDVLSPSAERALRWPKIFKPVVVVAQPRYSDNDYHYPNDWR